jgi:hypothetical protein
MRRAAVLLALLPLPCTRKAPEQLIPDPPPSATVQAATAVPTPSAAPTVDPQAAADKAAIDLARTQIEGIQFCASHNVLKDPSKPDDTDAVAKCAALDAERTQLDAIAKKPPELAKMLEDSKRLCSLDVPLISAADGLRQSQLSPSQASRRMTCGFAQKDIAKAKAYKPDDKRVRDLDTRIKRACQ